MIDNPVQFAALLTVTGFVVKVLQITEKNC